MYTLNCLSMAYVASKDFRIWSTRITIMATTTSWTMMRTRPGMVFRSRERIRLEMPQTAITERAMTNAPFSVTVTASEEQIPSTRTVMGFPLKMGFRMVSFNFASMAYSSSALNFRK